MVQIWVDADAIPKVIRDILIRAAQREQIITTFVANGRINLPASKYIKSSQVPQGFDEADNTIVDRMNMGDLVITADIPLANDVLNKGGYALNPRGYMYDLGTIEAKLTMRDFNETMRASGFQTKGPDPLSQRDRQLFANLLDTWLRQQMHAS